MTAAAPGSAARSMTPTPTLPVMTDVTQLVMAIAQGDAHAAAQLLPLVYDELRRLAAA